MLVSLTYCTQQQRKLQCMTTYTAVVPKVGGSAPGGGEAEMGGWGR